MKAVTNCRNWLDVVVFPEFQYELRACKRDFATTEP